MLIVIRGTMVVLIGALLLALPVMSGALPPAFFNGTTVYKADCTASNPNGAPACPNVPYQADISYKFGPNSKSTANCPGGVCTDADININRGVFIHVPNNFSVKSGLQGWISPADRNVIVCYNIPLAQRDLVNQVIDIKNKYITHQATATEDQQFCVYGNLQDCPDFATKGTCPAPKLNPLP